MPSRSPVSPTVDPPPVSAPGPTLAVAPGPPPDRSSEAGLATAELLGNAALGIAALVAIWGVLQTVGIDVMHWIRAQLLV